MRNDKDTLVKLFGRSVYANRDIQVGESILSNDVKYLKPAKGISARDYHSVIGSTARKNIKAGEPIQYDDIR